MPLSWSMDHLGPLTRTVADAALLLEIVAGHDPHDATSSRRGVPYYQRMLESPIGGLRVGVPENFYFDGITPEMDAAIRAAASVLGGLGALVRRSGCPDPRTLTDIGNVISRSESAALHARLARDRPHELQPAVRARLEIGFHISAHDYLQALRLRSRLAREFIAEVFAEVDALIVPVIPEPAPALETVKSGSVDDVVASDGALFAAHAAVQRARTAGAQRAVRAFVGRTAAGPADRRPGVRRSDDAASRPRVPAGHDVAPRTGHAL